MARILYLDDEEAIVFLVTRMLEFLGHRAAGYTVAADALAAFHREPESFDLLLTDLSMPHVSGFDFAQQVLAVRPAAPVAIVTGHVEARDEETAQAMGVLAVVPKPHTIEDMSKTIGELLKKAAALEPAER